MNSQFNVVFTGELKPGTDHDAFIKAFSQRFQCSEAKAAQLLESNKAITMKSAVEKDVAEKFRDVLEGMGMMIRLAPLPTERATFNASEPAAYQQPAVASTAATNPYQAPEANLQEDYEEGEMTGPVSVPFGHGAKWISTAYSNHFKGNAVAWVLAFILFGVISGVLQNLHELGAIISTLITPVLIAGLMLGAKAQDEGEEFTVGHLFSAFKQSPGQLILFGALYLVATIVILLIAGVIIGGSAATLGMAISGGDQAAMEALMQNPMSLLIAILVMLLLFIPLSMVYWFAPPLIAIDGVSALSAMRLSFIGGIKNVLPFTLYSIVILLLFTASVFTLFIGLLILFPVLMASMYTAYRDIYYPEV